MMYADPEYVDYSRNAVRGSRRLRNAILRSLGRPVPRQRYVKPAVPVFMAPHRRRGRPKGSSGPQLRKIEKIQLYAARACRVRIENLRSDKKTHRIANARQIAMFVSRKVTGVSYPELGKAFERDHTTVLYSVREVQKRIDAGDAKTIRALSAIHARLAG